MPDRLEVANELLSAFRNKISKPARTIYILDISGSMRGQRLADLKAALTGLTGADASLSSQFTGFRAQEEVLILTFSDQVSPNPLRADLAENLDQGLATIRTFANGLVADGQTALYTALIEGYNHADNLLGADPDRYTTIVLLTDGVDTVGKNLAEFETFYGGLPTKAKGVPTFTIHFGESDDTAMKKVADITRGEFFNEEGTASLSEVFQEIRGYQ